MKVVTLIALALGVMGAALLAYPYLPIDGPVATPAMQWTGLVLVIIAVLAIVLHIGLDVLLGQVIAPLVVGAGAVYLYDAIHATPTFASVHDAMARGGLEIGVQVQIFAGTVSTIYALLVAFLVFSAMTDHNNINAALQDEALHIDSMSEILPHLHDHSGPNAAAARRMHQLLIRYADNILSKQFAHEGHLAENQNLIDQVIDEIYRLHAGDDSDRIALGALVKRIDRLAQLRAQRIAFMDARPAPLMLVLLIVLSALVIAPYYVFETGGIVTQGFVGALAASMTYLFAMLIDMFSHFHGYWAVDRAPFADARARINARLEHRDGSQLWTSSARMAS